MSPMDLDAIRFPGQQNDERVLLFMRRHWMSFVMVASIVFMMVIMPIVMLVFFNLLNFNVQGVIVSAFESMESAYPAVRAQQFTIFLLSAYYFLVFSYFLVLWLDYYFDITIVTNERIIDIQQSGLFNRSVSELYLQQIQDVSGKQVGLIQSLFGFGNVFVQTAGSKSNFVIDHVKDCYSVARKIVDLQEALIERNKKPDDSVKVE